MQCAHNRTSMAFSKNFIIWSKIINTGNFLLLHVYDKCHLKKTHRQQFHHNE
jgi:hypothetical protein